MDDIGSVLGLVFFGVLVFGGIGATVWKIRRDDVDDVTDMRSVQLVRIADAKDQQMVRVVGRVVADPGEMTTAPVSGRPSVAWRLQLTAPWTMGRDSVVERDDSRAFAIDDGTGRAHIMGSFKIWALATRAEGEGSVDDMPPSLPAWLDENYSSDEWRALRKLRWQETRVEPGDTVCVVGIARVVVDQEGDAATYRDMPRRVELVGSDDAPLSISDDKTLLT